MNKEKSIKTNAALNVIKQCCSVLFPLILYPYITRILGSAQFGRISFAVSIIEYGIILAALGIPTYAVREASRIRDDKEKSITITSQVFSISLLSLFMTLVLLFVCVLFIPRLRQDWLLYSILSINIVSFIIGRDWINTIYEDYFYISIRFIVFKLISLILIFIFVKNSSDFLKYAIITVVADSGAYLFNIIYTQKYLPYKITNKIDFKKHLKPILYLFCTTVAVKIYIQSDITILGLFRSESEVGVYSLATKIYSVIKALLNAIIFVTIPRVSYYLGNKDLNSIEKLLFELKETLIVLVFPCVVGAILLSNNIVYLMGGKEFIQGTSAFVILTLSLYFAVLACYYAQAVLIPFRLEKKYFIFTSISALVNIALNIALIPLWGINAAALTTFLSEFIIFSTCRHEAISCLRVSNRIDYLPVIIGCILISIICYTINLLSLNVIVSTIIAFCLSVFVYFVVLLVFKNSLAVSIVNRIRRLFV